MDKSNRITFLNTLSTVLLMGISFFTAPIFTRLLGDSGYGMLQICTIWASVFAIVFPLQTQSTLASARVCRSRNRWSGLFSLYFRKPDASGPANAR